MTCRYSIVLKGNVVSNDEGYEFTTGGMFVELSKFKSLWKMFRHRARFAVVELSTGETWMYYYGRYRWRWERALKG